MLCGQSSGKRPAPRSANEVERVTPEKEVSAAQQQEERARRGQLVEDALPLGQRKLVLAPVRQVAVHALMVTSPRQVPLHEEGDSPLDGLPEEGAHAAGLSITPLSHGPSLGKCTS